MASKFSALPLLAVLVLAQIAAALRDEEPESECPWAVCAGATWCGASWPRIALGFGVALLAFFLTSPFAILDASGYVKQIVEQSRMVRGIADWPFTRQYRNTTPFVYQIVQQVRWGLGWPLGIVAFAGFGWTVVRQFRRPRAKELVLLGWALPYFLPDRYVYGQVYALHAALAAAFYPDGGGDDLGDWGLGNEEIGELGIRTG